MSSVAGRGADARLILGVVAARWQKLPRKLMEEALQALRRRSVPAAMRI